LFFWPLAAPGAKKSSSIHLEVPTRSVDVVFKAAQPEGMEKHIMKLSMKIVLGYVGVGAFVLLCAGAGLYGLQTVGQALDAPDTRVIEAIKRARLLIAGAGAGGLCLAIMAALYLARSVTTSGQKMAELAHMLTSGKLPATRDVTGQDEYSAVVRAVSTMAENFRQSRHELTNHATALKAVASDLSAVSNQIFTQSNTAHDAATTTTATVKEMIANMDTVVVHAQDTHTDVNAVATLAEQMTATIEAIAQNTTAALQEVTDAVQGVTTAAGHLSELDITVAELSKLPEAIMDIAAQTQCLALNAALAIARTGGSTAPGFTNVASDLEELARQTQSILEQVRQQITDLQQRVAGAVEDMQQISAVMHEADTCVENIATVIGTQTATTHAVAQHVTRMATELQETKGIVKHSVVVSQAIATDMAAVDALSAELGAAGTQMTTRATTLNNVSRALQEMTSNLA
jgi:methyl-accepting chemotaxis protein